MTASDDPREPQTLEVEVEGQNTPHLQAQDLSQTLADSEPATEVGHEKSWKTEEQILPKNNLPLVFFSLLLTTFLVRAFLKMCPPLCTVTDTDSNKHLSVRIGSNHVCIVLFHLACHGMRTADGDWV